jgi:hypothetical protein
MLILVPISKFPVTAYGPASPFLTHASKRAPRALLNRVWDPAVAFHSSTCPTSILTLFCFLLLLPSFPSPTAPTGNLQIDAS